MSFALGDPVWAKMKGFPAWPGRIAEPNELTKKATRTENQICVYFFGTHNFGWIDLNNIHPYGENTEALKKAGKAKSQFGKAVKEIEAFIADPNAVPEIKVSTPKQKKSLPESVDTSFNNSTANNDESIQEEIPTPKKASATKVKAVKVQQPKKTKASVKLTEESDESPAPKRSRKEVTSPIVSRNHINNNNDFSQDSIKSEILTPSITVRPNRAARAVIENQIDFLNLPEREELDVATITETLKSKNIKPSKQKFGFIGLGIMGSGIVKNLINSGHDVFVYNRTQDKTVKFEKAGAKVVLTPSDVIENADITFSCVADPEALKNTIFGLYGVASHNPDPSQEKGYVEMTTIDTNTSKDIESSLKQSGIRYLEAQIQGTKSQAEQGKLILLAAGDKTLFEQCQTCFEAMGKNSFFVGETGNATKMNLVLQTIAGIQIAGLADAMALTERAGLSTKKMMEIISSTNLKSDLIMEKGPAMIESRFTNVSLPLMHIQKDLRLAINMADSLNLPMPVAAIANEGYKNARRMGLSENDASAIFYRARH